MNTYKRIDDKECAAAKEYWEKNKEYWGKVGKIWADYINSHNVITLKNKIENKFMHEYLKAQAKDYATKKISDAEIDNTIKEEISRLK